MRVWVSGSFVALLLSCASMTMLTLFTACMSGELPQARVAPPNPPGPASTPTTSAAATAPPPVNPTQDAADILDRANAIFPIANRAVQLDGTPQTAQVANQMGANP